MKQISSLPDIDNIIYSSSQPVVTVFVSEMQKLLVKLFEKGKQCSQYRS